MRLKDGLTVLHYRIERRLGTGGMGEVYLARDTNLDQPVAIKFLSAPDDGRARKRLLSEAKAAAALRDQPGICAVYEVGSDPAYGDFVVMQYVDGEPLADRLRRGRLETSDALLVGARLAEALVVAHDRGIVHRDVKPQNIILTESGRPVLLDFGLAKRALTKAEMAEASTTEGITKPYSLVGTPGYMSPEQIRNGRIDRRADLFGLGCVIYECLTGRRAFPGPTSADAIGQVLHTEPAPVSSIVPGVAAGVDTLCTRLMAKDVRERCQSAAEALGMIQTLLPPGANVPSVSTKRTRTLTLAWRDRPRAVITTAVATVIVIAAAVGWWQWRHRWQVHVPLPDAKTWFDKGVSRIREGAYAGARSDFEEAIHVDSDYAQAHARLADAMRELDDLQGAKTELLKVNDLVPNRRDLNDEDRLQLEAVMASVLPDHARAIATYTELTNRHPNDAAARLDLGRAQEAAYRLQDARKSYTKALDLDHQYAAALTRLGLLQGTPPKDALTYLSEAARLSHTAGDVEGENEALLRKGVVLNNSAKYDEARAALQQVLAQTADSKYTSQRLRAQFALVLPLSAAGGFSEAVSLGSKAVDAATAAGWQGLAANGLVDVGNALLNLKEKRLDDASEVFTRAIALAKADGAERTAMRAQTALASQREAAEHPQEALDLLAEPLKFFAENHYVQSEVNAKNVEARAYGDLERYEDAFRLAKEVMNAVEATGTDSLIAQSLETRAGLLRVLGRFPEALVDRDRLESIHRAQRDQALLPYDLNNRAGLLIELGREQDARQSLDELTNGIANSIETYKRHAPRAALLRALLASVARRYPDVLVVVPDPGSKPAAAADETAAYSRLLAEHARAALGRSSTPTATIEQWLGEITAAEFHRELAYWVSDTLLLRGDPARALSVALAALAEPAGKGNFELSWRLEAEAARAGAGKPESATMPALAQADLQRLGDQWGGADSAAFKQYLARPDLTELRRAIHP